MTPPTVHTGVLNCIDYNVRSNLLLFQRTEDSCIHAVHQSLTVTVIQQHVSEPGFPSVQGESDVLVN